MKKIQVKELSLENFGQYGSFTDILNPRHPFYKEEQLQFYPDKTQINLGNSTSASISVSLEEKRRENVIEFAEIHHNTGEGMVCLDDDVIIYCAPATGREEVPLDYMEAFYVPKGVLVTLKMRVWHGSQFPVNQEKAHIIIILPEKTYAKDCICKFLEPEKQIEIESYGSYYENKNE